MKRPTFLFVLLGVLVLSCIDSNGSGTPSTPEPPSKDLDYLVDASYVGIIEPQTLALALTGLGYESFAPLLKSEVEFYKVTYTTQYKKEDITASGVLMVSKELDANFPTVVYEHGTITQDEAPSIKLGATANPSREVYMGLSIASMNNCAVLIPDYIGYGESEEIPHPYLHNETLGQASLDFIRACAEVTNDNLKEEWMNKNLFITGYSEGGHAAVALQKTIQETSNTGYTIAKVLAGAGAYDQYNFAKEFLSKTEDLDAHTVSSYLWVLDMYKKDYDYSKDYEDMFSSTDYSLLEGINFNMGYFNPEALTTLNTNPQSLFKEDFRTGVIEDSDTEFISILNENSLTNFAPKDSLIFVYGTNDTWVYPSCTVNTYTAMAAKGCKVRAYPLPGGNHTTTLPYYLRLLLNRLQTYQ